MKNRRSPSFENTGWKSLNSPPLDAAGLTRLERVDVDLVDERFVHLGVRDETAVGGPGVVVDVLQVERDVDVLVLGLVDFHDLLRGDVDEVQRQGLVGERDLLPVRRPAERVAIAVPEIGQLLRRRGAGRVDRVEVVLAVAVGEEGDRRAVGRPRRVLFARARRSRSGCA